MCAIVKGHWTDLSNVLTLGENIFVQDEANTTVISSAFSLSRTVSKTENNKGSTSNALIKSVYLANIVYTYCIYNCSNST